MDFQLGAVISAAMVPAKQATPSIIKIIAPTRLCFQEIAKMDNKISDGRLCIKSPIKISLGLEAESKMSREKTARKSANKIISILGAQKVALWFMWVD